MSLDYCTGTLLAIPSLASAQHWSAEETEVLEALNACLRAEVDKDMQAELDCAHEDFIGWRNDLPALRDNAFHDGNVRRMYETGGHMIGFSVQPLSVRVYGDIAIIHYDAYYYYRRNNGEDYSQRSR